MNAEKRCTKCGEVKPLEKYPKHGRGRRGECKPCRAAYQREYQSKNRERIAAGTREYYVKNREKIAAAQREYVAQNKERTVLRRRKWYAQNRERVIKKSRAWYAQNRERGCARAKRWRENNSERSAAVKRAHTRARRKTDPAFRMASTLRTRLRDALRGRSKKSACTERLLGCTFNEARAHIEGQFKDGMSWGNRGSFHIDHILPVIAFNLLNPAHQRMCFCYLNLQPLTPQENQRKGDSLPPNHEAHLAKLQAFVDGRPL